MAALRSLGTLLHDSGWTTAITGAGVSTSGTAESFLSASSVTKTRQAHQVTACSLYQLMKEAYQDQRSSENATEGVTFEDTQLGTFTLIRSFREGNFDLYRAALFQLAPAPYFFANSNVNYSIHLRDIMSLGQQHPEVVQEFH